MATEVAAGDVAGESFAAGDGPGLATAAKRESTFADSGEAARVVARVGELFAAARDPTGVGELFATPRGVPVFWFVSRAWLVKSARVEG